MIIFLNPKLIKNLLPISIFFMAFDACAWFCPNNFNQINAGDSIELVEKQCGAPLEKKMHEAESNVPQEWVYYVAISQASAGGYPASSANASSAFPPVPTLQPSSQASVKMTIALAEGRVINMTVQEMSLASTSICGPTINVGDSAKTIEAACGKPGLINKQQIKEIPVIVTELKYATSPPNTLVFKSGKLQERK